MLIQPSLINTPPGDSMSPPSYTCDAPLFTADGQQMFLNYAPWPAIYKRLTP